MEYATANGYKVCISALTGKLAARYARKFRGTKCNTVHTNFFIPVGNQQENGINWSLSDVSILIIDEVFTWYYCLFKKNINTCIKAD